MMKSSSTKLRIGSHNILNSKNKLIVKEFKQEKTQNLKCKRKRQYRVRKIQYKNLIKRKVS